MSEYETKPGEFSLFPASDEDKERVSKDLVMTGKGVDLSGSECWVSVFKATRKDGTPVKTKDGKQIYNMRLKAKGASGSASSNVQFKSVPKHASDDLDDDIPFS